MGFAVERANLVQVEILDDADSGARLVGRHLSGRLKRDACDEQNEERALHVSEI